MAGVRLTDSECTKRVSPGCEVGCGRVLSRTAETKSAMAQTQVGTRGRGLGQGVSITGDKVEQLGQAAQNVSVMLGSEHSCERRWKQPKTVVHARRRTEQQQKPRELQVMNAREQLEGSTVLHGKVLELRSDALVRSQGAA